MILIIDDDQAVQASLKLLFRHNGIESAGCKRPARALEWLDRRRPDLIILDMNFSIQTSGEEGLALLQQIVEKDASIPVILITGWASLELAVKGIKIGAQDFISKPWDNDHLLQTAQTLIALSTFQGTTSSRRELDEQYDFRAIIGEDKALLKVLSTVGRVAATDASVLILGESGTGKELIAEAIHKNSQRQGAPFVKVNLGGIPGSLFESELFGHRKGAFTDARFDRKGRFELADGGTIFLDEIGELELINQVKLLRVLQDRTFEVLGSSDQKKVNVRVISATNKQLAEEVGQGRFREDLFYRINLITIQLPALRERPSDIPRLVHYYMEQFKRTHQRPEIRISTAAMDWLQDFPFPGNIRQLKNLLERTVLITPHTQLEPGDFEMHLGQQVTKAEAMDLPQVGSMTLDEIERSMIVKAMKYHQNNVAKVANALGLNRNALYRRLEKYKIPF